ncbi:tectonic-1 [Callorhinchus milii]|uniref:tectonic-1 n=1 Tax=Callorhinchus milii TaxID=7868 RepID=UPI001C3F92E7|nr:tectonic-1 [Callorhinchus milii]
MMGSPAYLLLWVVVGVGVEFAVGQTGPGEALVTPPPSSSPPPTTTPGPPNVTADAGNLTTEQASTTLRAATSDGLTGATEETVNFTDASGLEPVPLPLSGALPPLEVNVQNLCTCDLLVDQCDPNCCCDPYCKVFNFTTFTNCIVEIVRDDSELCYQEAVKYTTNILIETTVKLINPSIFCIARKNYKMGSSFLTPEMPTPHNFESLVNRFGGFFFGTNTETPDPTRDKSTGCCYQYGVPIQTNNGFLRIPVPLVTSECVDDNPAGFLVDQVSQCTRKIDITKDCVGLAALNVTNYLDFIIFSIPNQNSGIQLNITSVVLQSLEGTQTLLNNPDIGILEPVLIATSGVCNNVILGVNYELVYNDKGKIVAGSGSFTLGAISSKMLPIQQRFQIKFTQTNTTAIPLSGNPGYVVGHPLLAGFRQTGSPGIIQSTNRFGQLTVLSSFNQDCLQREGLRLPVLFGINVQSGCLLRLTNATGCKQWSQIITNVLVGNPAPQLVASFGNSQAQDEADWVTIAQSTSRIQTCDCRLPQSLHLDVTWVKYGSFVNPQAKIKSVTQRFKEICIAMPLRETQTLPISSSVSFTDLSTPAEPGYKAIPTIDVELPYDFFFPFV